MRIVAAGAPPPTRTIERVLDELGWEFIQIYGLTETSPLVTVNRQRAEWDELSTHDRARNLGRAGAPALGVKIMVDEDGEVLTASNHNLDGYWEQPEATEEAQAGNWFHTGDGGRIDDDGYLVIQDRKKDVIISGGENVSSIEVEDALMSHDAVKEVAVIGIPDEKWGELVTALVVTTGPAPRPAGGADQALPRVPRRLQVPEAGRVRRRATAHRDRQAAEVQAARAVLEGPRAASQLNARSRRKTRHEPLESGVAKQTFRRDS